MVDKYITDLPPAPSVSLSDEIEIQRIASPTQTEKTTLGDIVALGSSGATQPTKALYTIGGAGDFADLKTALEFIRDTPVLNPAFPQVTFEYQVGGVKNTSTLTSDLMVVGVQYGVRFSTDVQPSRTNLIQMNLNSFNLYFIDCVDIAWSDNAILTTFPATTTTTYTTIGSYELWSPAAGSRVIVSGSVVNFNRLRFATPLYVSSLSTFINDGVLGLDVKFGSDVTVDYDLLPVTPLGRGVLSDANVDGHSRLTARGVSVWTLTASRKSIVNLLDSCDVGGVSVSSPQTNALIIDSGSNCIISGAVNIVNATNGFVILKSSRVYKGGAGGALTFTNVGTNYNMLAGAANITADGSFLEAI